MSKQDLRRLERRDLSQAQSARGVQGTSYGRACVRCKVYFVTRDPEAYTCPWCLKGETGENFDFFDSADSASKHGGVGDAAD